MRNFPVEIKCGPGTSPETSNKWLLNFLIISCSHVIILKYDICFYMTSKACPNYHETIPSLSVGKEKFSSFRMSYLWNYQPPARSNLHILSSINIVVFLFFSPSCDNLNLFLLCFSAKIKTAFFFFFVFYNFFFKFFHIESLIYFLCAKYIKDFFSQLSNLRRPFLMRFFFIRFTEILFFKFFFPEFLFHIT